MGKAIKMPIKIILVKSVDNNLIIPQTLEPKTLRIPISLERRSAVKAVKPSKPKQESRIAKNAKYLDRLATLASAAYSR